MRGETGGNGGKKSPQNEAEDRETERAQDRERERKRADRVSRLADFEPFETQVEIIQLCVPC